MTESEVFETMASAMAERGLVTQDQITSDRAALTARLTGEPAPVAQTTSATTGVVLAPTQQPTQTQADPLDAISAAAFQPPDSPAGYKFDPLPAGVQHDPQQELAMRAIFHEAGIPNGIAGQVNKMYSQAIQNPPTASQIERTAQETHLQLSRTFGDQASKVIEVAQREFRAMAARQPRLVDMVERSGLGNNFYVISSLYNTARAKGRA